jgi:hypothetical protein
MEPYHWQDAIHYKTAPEHFIDRVFNYPTLAESCKIAALDAVTRLD